MFAFLFVLKKNLCFMFSCLICKTIEAAGLKSEQNSMSLPICLGTYLLKMMQINEGIRIDVSKWLKAVKAL